MLIVFLANYHLISKAYLETRVALIISNSAYQSMPVLRNPVNDARTMDRALADVGFQVMQLENATNLITVLGHAAMISAGEFVQASGAWINDRTHGVQFRASFLKATAPTTIEGIEKYLGSGMIRGIGPIYAKKLVRAFGEAVFDVIEQEPQRLREVTGIGPKRVERIVGGWAE